MAQNRIYDAIYESFAADNINRKHYQILRTTDLHTCGEPLRVLTQGGPDFQAKSILGMRREMMEKYDWIRQCLIYEPRGHADMYGCIITPPERPESDFGILFMHNEGYSTMCGHAIIAITKLIYKLSPQIPEGSLPGSLLIDTPCGQVLSKYNKNNTAEFSCSFVGVPAFVSHSREHLHIPEYGLIEYSIAFGGAFYAYVNADLLNLDLHHSNVQEIKRLGRLLKVSILAEGVKLIHPQQEDLSFLYGVIFWSQSSEPGIFLKNVCVFADGEVDRSPTGSGVCGHLARLYQRGDITLDSPTVVIESIVGTRFRGQVLREIDFAGLPAVMPRVEGSAYITGTHNFFIDPDDPLTPGFLLR